SSPTYCEYHGTSEELVAGIVDCELPASVVAQQLRANVWIRIRADALSADIDSTRIVSRRRRFVRRLMRENWFGLRLTARYFPPGEVRLDVLRHGHAAASDESLDPFTIEFGRAPRRVLLHGRRVRRCLIGRSAGGDPIIGGLDRNRRPFQSERSAVNDGFIGE